MEEFDNLLFKPTARPRNRAEVRAMLFDRKRFEPLLKEVGDMIDEAIAAVNNDTLDSVSMYTMYHDRFNLYCDLIERKKPKFWKINRKFYTEILKHIALTEA